MKPSDQLEEDLDEEDDDDAENEVVMNDSYYEQPHNRNMRYIM